MSIRIIEDEVEQVGESVSMPIRPRGPAGSSVQFATVRKVGDRERVEIQGEYIPSSKDPETGENKEGAWFFGENFAISDSGEISTLHYDPIKNAGAKFFDTSGDGIADSVHLELVDGGYGDKDGIVNGVIKEQR